MTIADLELMAARMRSVAEVAQELGPSAADVLQDHVNDHAGRGLDPDGNPWPLTKTGTAPLQHAAENVRYSSTPRKAVAIVTGQVHALHHLGRANGAPQRRIVPSELTEALALDLRERLTAKLREASDG